MLILSKRNEKLICGKTKRENTVLKKEKNFLKKVLTNRFFYAIMPCNKVKSPSTKPHLRALVNSFPSEFIVLA